MEKIPKQKSANLIKIVLFGPESTGKTTLSKLLARHYNTVWVREFARKYLQDKWNNERLTCQDTDLVPIAIGQINSENELSKKADRVLICDTDLLETKVYSEEYYGGFVDEDLDKSALENQYDLYLLTYIDTPWEKDDLRDRPEQRKEMFDAFENALKKYHRPYITLKGDVNNRLNHAVEAIDEILKTRNGLDIFSKNI